MQTDPRFFSVVTVAYNDAWALTKTARSVFRQTHRDFEYIVVDGGSEDHTLDLVAFWEAAGLVHRWTSAPDTGVYNAMNKGLSMASGEVVLFLNASDVFKHDDVLATVRRQFEARPEIDGVLGWGELNGKYWTSWTEDEAFKLSSLGFCHQALYVRRARLAGQPFDERPVKTDSDTLQLGRLYAEGADIAILPELLAVRGGAPGISSNPERTRVSIVTTLTEEYGIPAVDAATILAFRRRCEKVTELRALLEQAERDNPRLARHLAYMVLDTLFQRRSAKLGPTLVQSLMTQAMALLLTGPAGEKGRGDIARLAHVQTRRAELLEEAREARNGLAAATAQVASDEERRIAETRELHDIASAASRKPMVVSLTTSPARLSTVHLVIRSLFAQTVRPEAVHLWLGRDAFRNRNALPETLRDLESEGLEIHFAERTFHRYDTFLHNAAINAERPFVLVDDGVLYPPTALASLWEGHRRHPEAVVGNRCHGMVCGADDALAAYADWPRQVRREGTSMALFPTLPGGVLYPPGALSDPRATDIGALLSCAPYAGDVWLKACSLAQGRPSYATELSHMSDWCHRPAPTMPGEDLTDLDVTSGLRDLQISRVGRWLDAQWPDWLSAIRKDGFVARQKAA